MARGSNVRSALAASPLASTRSHAVLYNGPMQAGPANLLYGRRTCWRTTMVGFPYDNVSSWCPPYSPEVFATQFERLAAGWQTGLDALQLAVAGTPADKRIRPRPHCLWCAACLYFSTL